MNVANLISKATRTIQRTIGTGKGTVRYYVGAEYVDVPAGLGHSELEIVNADGVVVTTWRPRDFLIVAAELVLNGVQITPAIGHRIVLTVGNATETYTVAHPDPQQAPWRYSDPFNVTLRIHTNRTGVQS